MMKHDPILILSLELFFVVGSMTTKYLLVDIDPGIDNKLPKPILVQDPKGIMECTKDTSLFSNFFI